MESLASGGGEAASHLERVVDDPLHAGEGTHHEDPSSESLPEPVEADFAVDLLNLVASRALSLPLVQDGDHGVGGVGNHGAEDTGDVAGEEGDHELGGLSVLVLGLGEDVGVEVLHDLLEGHELHDGVGHLSGPEGLQTLVESVGSLGRVHELVSLGGLGGEGSLVGGLHPDLEGLEGAEEAVSNDFGAGGGEGESDSLVLLGVLLAGDASVDILEDLVESELSESLGGVSNEGGEPSNGESLESLLGLDLSESISDSAVESGTGLHSALDDVEGADEGMGDSAGEDSSGHALLVVLHIVDV
mmetsp:Transcript_13057/g.22034  ORF Transcript_13057/g.22034 Transcript_13057/m.22034 type:complete len:302 (+) Transcript_13057:28-933(+)